MLLKKKLQHLLYLVLVSSSRKKVSNLYNLIVSDPVFAEIGQTIQAKPDQAKAVNSVYLFVIKTEGQPVKRWCKHPY